MGSSLNSDWSIFTVAKCVRIHRLPEMTDLLMRKALDRVNDEYRSVFIFTEKYLKVVFPFQN